MKVQHALMLTAGLLLSAPVLAEDGAALMKKNNCSTCHQVANKTVGPALKAIAAKYAGDAGAAAKLEKKVRVGGAGSFGTMPMPATPAKVSDGDIKTMVAHILATK
ncbi:MAG: c-type cytochrome [Sideroxydans sp.]|nr:c-type cytochrome [Sideroxydans sp.]